MPRGVRAAGPRFTPARRYRTRTREADPRLWTPMRTAWWIPRLSARVRMEATNPWPRGLCARTQMPVTRVLTMCGTEQCGVSLVSKLAAGIW